MDARVCHHPQVDGRRLWAGAPHYNRDVNKAKALLQAAGVSNLSLSLAVVDVDADKTVAQVVQQNLADIGITVNINVQDNATFNQIPGPGGSGKNRQLVYSHYVTEPDPSWSIVWFTCAQVDQWNWAEWCDKQFSNLYNQALRVQNPAKRTQIYIQMQKIWDANANTIWVGYPTDFYAGKKGLTPTLRPDGEVLAAWFRAT